MPGGRPPKGLGHVDALPGDAPTKERMKAILATLAEDLSVPEACERLGIGASRFHELRRLALEAMRDGLAPRPPGRPPNPPEEDEEVTRLKGRIDWLEEELEISRLRTEIAMWKPSLLRDPVSSPPEKGGSSSRRVRRRRRRKGGGGTVT
jgi:transposase-like protein